MSFSVSGQSSFEGGFLPKVIFSKKYNDNMKWINSIESRTDVFSDTFKIQHNLIDLSSILSVKTDLYQAFNIGYILRILNNTIIHRTFQHYNIINDFETSQLAHRFAFEQFFEPKIPIYLRGRYPLNYQKPLNGDRIDIREFYIKLGNEYLWNFRSNELEVRFTPYFGYQLSKKDRIEFGFDYRTVKLNDNNLWFRTTWYISI
jgi:hypothetical protein